MVEKEMRGASLANAQLKESPSDHENDQNQVDPAMCFGFNLLKIAKMITMIGGCTLIACCIMYYLNVIKAIADVFVKPGQAIINFYLM